MNAFFRCLRSYNCGKAQSKYAPRASFAALIITVAMGVANTVASAQAMYRI